MTSTGRPRPALTSRKASILANLFPAAHCAVEPFEAFRWHSGAGDRYDTFKVQSSQALAIDVFGTLHCSESRDTVLDAMASHLSLPTGGPWELALEWHDPDNLLQEKQPTWVDAVARSPHALMFFECKFTESDGGSCSQTQPLRQGRRKGIRQCNGRYMWQVNPANNQEARCALTAKGIRYWDIVPQVFDYDADASYFECPFAGPWFQWMRNLTICYAVARHHRLRAALVVAYADGPGLPMAARIRSREWTHLQDRLQRDAVALHSFSYQTLLTWASAAAPDDETWPALTTWVQNKIDTVCAAKAVVAESA